MMVNADFATKSGALLSGENLGPRKQNDLYTYTGRPNINLFLCSTLSQSFAVYDANQ